jgi:hypothetical protein
MRYTLSESSLSVTYNKAVCDLDRTIRIVPPSHDSPTEHTIAKSPKEGSNVQAKKVHQCERSSCVFA